MTKKILITGGTGFIGYHLAKKCIKLNWKVSSLSSNRPKKVRKLKKVKYLIADISSKKKIKNKIKRNYDYVVNLAGYVDHSKKIKTIKSHYYGCKKISEFFLKSKIKKFVQVGSSIEYGKIRSPQIEKNINKQKTFSAYGKAKLLSTKHLLNLHRKFKFPAVILRLYLVYGPGQDANRVIPITILNAIKNENFNCSDGLQLRDFVHIDDVTDAIIKTLKTNKVCGNIFNIGSGQPVQIKKIILKICRLVGSGRPQFGKIKLRKDEISSLYPDVTKAKKILNWKPKIKLNLGLLKTVNYYKKNG
ncbi:NAD-dependent epimerase/dehydratase family protein [Candidatus Pelagibacter bacterium nBUS_36]|uniref:NAD-dependent epimerase/dehydratase family protein n=1 Tax=Candidatus Pelagibacter bacterium nBUS_36 TaxID=3374194 RepID=UPI003EB9BD91